MQKNYGFVYIWYDRKRKMYYIGSHLGLVDDGYICSSNRMRKAYQRRPNDFKRRILKFFDIINYVDLLQEEENILQKIKNEELGKKYYNLRKKAAHWASSDKDKLTIGQKISKTKIERKVHAGKNHWNYGKKHSEETKRKIGAKSVGRIISEEGRRKISERHKGNKYSLGNKLSEETKKKISLNHWTKNPNISEERKDELKKTLFQKKSLNK